MSAETDQNDLEPTPPPPPPQPELPDTPPVYEPSLWYRVTATCLTQDNGRGEPCPNLNKVFSIDTPANTDGSIYVQCALCGNLMTQLTGTLLDPQPDPF